MKRIGPALLLLGLVGALAGAWWIVADATEPVLPGAPEASDAAQAPTQADLPETGEDGPLAGGGRRAPDPTSGDEIASLDVVEELTLAVTHAGGEPAYRAIVVVLEEEGALHGDAILMRAETDGDGRLTLPGWSQPVELLVGGVCWTPVRHGLAEGRGAHEVVLPEGAVLAGEVLVDGHPPTRPLLLTLLPEPRTSGWHHSLRNQFERRLAGIAAYTRRWNAILTGPDGSFRVSGLPEDWDGYIQVPFAYDFGEAMSHLHEVRKPATDIVLAVYATAAMKGRVVDDSGEPVTGALVAWEMACENGSGHDDEVVTDGGGRFEIAMRYGPVRSLELVAHGPGGRYRAARRYGHMNDTSNHDLGDLTLGVTRRVSFRAVDEEGQPIAGARATSDIAGIVPSGPTNGQGLGVLGGLPADATEIIVHAARHASTAAPIGSDPEELLTVTMAPCPLLEIVVSTPEGAVPSGLIVALEAEGRILQGDIWGGDPLRDEFGVARAESYRWNNSVASLRLSVGPTGRLLLSCLRPGVSMSLQLEDATGSRASEPRYVLLKKGEQRTVQLVATKPPLALLCRVEDAAGKAVSDAVVRLDETHEVRVDEDGRAVLDNLYGERADLLVVAPGYKPLERLGEPLPAPGEVLRLVLERN